MSDDDRNKLTHDRHAASNREVVERRSASHRRARRHFVGVDPRRDRNAHQADLGGAEVGGWDGLGIEA